MAEKLRFRLLTPDGQVFSCLCEYLGCDLTSHFAFIGRILKIIESLIYEVSSNSFAGQFPDDSLFAASFLKTIFEVQLRISEIIQIPVLPETAHCFRRFLLLIAFAKKIIHHLFLCMRLSVQIRCCFLKSVHNS